MLTTRATRVPSSDRISLGTPVSFSVCSGCFPSRGANLHWRRDYDGEDCSDDHEDDRAEWGLSKELHQSARVGRASEASRGLPSARDVLISAPRYFPRTNVERRRHRAEGK